MVLQGAQRYGLTAAAAGLPREQSCQCMLARACHSGRRNQQGHTLYEWAILLILKWDYKTTATYNYVDILFGQPYWAVLLSAIIFMQPQTAHVCITYLCVLKKSAEYGVHDSLSDDSLHGTAVGGNNECNVLTM